MICCSSKTLGEECWPIIAKITYACMTKEHDVAISEPACTSVAPSIVSPMSTIGQTIYSRVRIGMRCTPTQWSHSMLG